MKTHTNPTCAACPYAHNALNGRFCDYLEAYVEYSPKPTCNHQP